MVRAWLITSTTYGTWLPGDARGFVGTVRDYRPGDDAAAAAGIRTRHNEYGTEPDRDLVGLRRASETLLKGEPIVLSADQAALALAQFLETARHRGWSILAAAVMANHFHIVATAPEAALSADLLRDFKSYASRVLNREWGKPRSGTWWTESGSRRSLPDESAVRAAVRYVAQQYQPLAVWVAPEFAVALDSNPHV